MSIHDTDPHTTDETDDARDPRDHVVAFTTEDDRLVVYDELQPTAWIQSTRSVYVVDSR
ncbi:DUF7331 family protein [Natrialbaceae archaeon A-gly3]